MNSLQTIVMGSTPMAAALPEATGDNRSQEEGGGEFAALLAMLFVPLPSTSGQGEKMPILEGSQEESASSGKQESAQIALAQRDGKTVSPAVVGPTAKTDESRPLGVSLTGRKDAVFSLFSQKEGLPAVKISRPMEAYWPQTAEAVMGPLVHQPEMVRPEMIRNVSPGAEIAANLVSPDGQLKVLTAGEKVDYFGAGRAETSAKVVSIPLSQVKNGEAVIPVVLPSGERVTLIFTDLPTDGPVGQGEAAAHLGAVRTMPDIAMAAKAGERAVSNGEASLAASPLRGEKDPEKVIRVVLQVRPEAPPQAAAAPKAGSGIESGENIRMVLQTRQSPSFFGEEKSRPVVEKGTEGAFRTDSSATSGQAVSGIRVLNQSSRTVEVTLRQEPIPAAPAVKAAAKGEIPVAAQEIVLAETSTAVKSTARPEKTPATMEGEVPKAPLTTAPAAPAGIVHEATPRASQALPEQEIIDQVTKSVSQAQREIPSEMSVRLKPDHLGNLHLKVSVDGDQVTVRIQVENTAVKQILENNMGQLKDSFGTIGLRMDNVSVSLGMQSGGMQSGWERGQGHLWQEGRGNNGSHMSREETGQRLDDPPQPAGRIYPARRERLLDMTI